MLLVPDPRYSCDCLIDAMVGAADRVAFVQQPSDIVDALLDADLLPAVIVTPLADRTAETRALLAFVRAVYPQVWRLGYVVDGRDEPARRDPFPLLELGGGATVEVDLVVRINHQRSCGQLRLVPSPRVLPC